MSDGEVAEGRVGQVDHEGRSASAQRHIECGGQRNRNRSVSDLNVHVESHSVISVGLFSLNSSVEVHNWHQRAIRTNPKSLLITTNGKKHICLNQV